MISIIVSTINHISFSQFLFSVWVGEILYCPISATHTHTHMYTYTLGQRCFLNCLITIALNCVPIKYPLGLARRKFSQVFSCNLDGFAHLWPFPGSVGNSVQVIPTTQWCVWCSVYIRWLKLCKWSEVSSLFCFQKLGACLRNSKQLL